jgi:hypothetical protein
LDAVSFRNRPPPLVKFNATEQRPRSLITAVHSNLVLRCEKRITWMGVTQRFSAAYWGRVARCQACVNLVFRPAAIGHLLTMR